MTRGKTQGHVQSMLYGMTRPLVKVCGLTRLEDVALCHELNIDFTGFIFVASSPRCLTAAEAAALPRGRAIRVGVFAGQSLDEVQRIMDETGLDYAQLHGGEDADFCRALGAKRVIKTLWPQRYGLFGPALLEALHADCAVFKDACSLFLLDAGNTGGGSGKELPRSDLAAFVPPRPWLLAGGLGPANAAKALRECAPTGLDCNSGVESAPGVKDEKALREFMRRIAHPQ